MHLEAKALLEAHQHTLFNHLKSKKHALLARNVDQNMPKNAYFWKKAVKLLQCSSIGLWAAGGSASSSPYCYSRLLIWFVECVSSIKLYYYFKNTVTEVTNSRGVKIFLPQGAGYPLATQVAYQVGAQILGAHQHILCSHSKTPFKQKFRPSMFKDAYFGEKTVKISTASRHEAPFSLAAGGSTPRPPRCYSHLLLQFCPVRF